MSTVFHVLDAAPDCLNRPYAVASSCARLPSQARDGADAVASSERCQLHGKELNVTCYLNPADRAASARSNDCDQAMPTLRVHPAVVLLLGLFAVDHFERSSLSDKYTRRVSLPVLWKGRTTTTGQAPKSKRMRTLYGRQVTLQRRGNLPRATRSDCS